MGFPLAYWELQQPRFLLYALFLIRYVRHCVFSALNFISLRNRNLVRGNNEELPQTELLSTSGTFFDEALPVVPYNSTVQQIRDGAVCLYEFEANDEVRRLSNCCHVFHRCCLDRWIEHGQRTCPLSRSLLLPQDMPEYLYLYHESYEAVMAGGSYSTGSTCWPTFATSSVSGISGYLQTVVESVIE